MTTTLRLSKLAITVAALTTLPAMAGISIDSGNTTFKFGGYIKIDAMASNYSDGDLAAGNLGRDFYVPSLTPVGGADEDTAFDMHARQSRFNLATVSKLENGETIETNLEFDFMATAGGDERITNSYTPRMRHATIKYGDWLVGQTWSNFQDVSALPETLDFIGVTDGTVFARQAQIRYSTGNFSFAIENPESTVTPFGGGTRIVADDNALPDFTARYTHKADWGQLSVAGIVRQLSYQDGAAIDDSVTSAGIAVSGSIKLAAKDKLQFMVVSGAGLGRYVGLNTTNGAVLDDNNQLETIDVTGGFIAYQHYWNDQWRSTFTYSMLSIDNNTALTGMSAIESTASWHANLLYSPVKNLTVGAEIGQANKSLESGADGDLTRVQFSAKYSF